MPRRIVKRMRSGKRQEFRIPGKLLQYGREPPDGHAGIGIDIGYKLSGTCVESGFSCPDQTFVGFIHYLYADIRCRNFPGPVGAGIVDDDDFRGKPCPVDFRLHGTDASAYVVLFVVCRYDETDFHKSNGDRNKIFLEKAGLLLFIEYRGTEIFPQKEKGAYDHTETHGNPYSLERVFRSEKRSTEKITYPDKGTGPYGFSGQIYAYEGCERDTGKSGGKKYGDREPEPVGYLGDEKDRVAVPSEESYHFPDIGLAEPEVFPESGNEGIPYPVPDKIPNDVSYEVSGDDGEQEREEVEIPYS